MAARLTHWIMRQWLVRGWFSALMLPLAWCVGRVVARKHAAYANGSRQAFHPGVPVVVVGNILVGGTGKTPVVIAVTRHLQRIGRRPGVLSRGYGTRGHDTPQVGMQDLDPARFGDEPALINHRTGAPVAVHRSRALAARALLAAYPDVDVLVCDDGLQHLALARDIEIVVQDQRGLGNGRLLPAGPLREPASRLQTVQAIITNRRSARSQPEKATPSPAVAGRGAADGGASGPMRVVMHIVPGQTRAVHGGGQRTLEQWAGMAASVRISAAAGIGMPSAFFDMLTQAGIPLQHRIGLTDHFDYRVSPFAGLDTDFILVTSKDGVKCRHLEDIRIWEVPIEACFSPPNCLEHLLASLPQRHRP